jgi:hypothetical protein
LDQTSGLQENLVSGHLAAQPSTFGCPTFHFWLQFRTDEINKSIKIITKQLTDAQQTPLAEDKDNVKVPKVKNIVVIQV